jgi:hypothetical protein
MSDWGLSVAQIPFHFVDSIFGKYWSKRGVNFGSSHIITSGKKPRIVAYFVQKSMQFYSKIGHRIKSE